MLRAIVLVVVVVLVLDFVLTSDGKERLLSITYQNHGSEQQSYQIS
jgi:hypothetical protein